MQCSTSIFPFVSLQVKACFLVEVKKRGDGGRKPPSQEMKRGKGGKPSLFRTTTPNGYGGEQQKACQLISPFFYLQNRGFFVMYLPSFLFFCCSSITLFPNCLFSHLPASFLRQVEKLLNLRNFPPLVIQCVSSLVLCFGIGLAIPQETGMPIADTILSATDRKENCQ